MTEISNEVQVETLVEDAEKIIVPKEKQVKNKELIIFLKL